MGHKHDPNKARTSHDMCEVLEHGQLTGDIRKHGSERIFPGQGGFIHISDRHYELDPVTRKQIIRRATLLRILPILGVVAVIAWVLF